MASWNHGCRRWWADARKLVSRFYIEEATLYNLAKSIHRTILLSHRLHCDICSFWRGPLILVGRAPVRLTLRWWRWWLLMLHSWWLTRLRAMDDQSLQGGIRLCFRAFSRQIREQVALGTAGGVGTNTSDLIRLKEGKKALYRFGKTAIPREKIRESGTFQRYRGWLWVLRFVTTAATICGFGCGELEWNGLSPLEGRFRRWNRLGIMVDVSHAFWKLRFTMWWRRVRFRLSLGLFRGVVWSSEKPDRRSDPCHCRQRGVVQICLYNE